MSRLPLLLVAAFAMLAHPALAEPAPTKAQCLDAYTQSQPLRRDGKLTEARRALLICARDPCPAQLQPDCVGWLTEVERAIPSIVLAASDGAGRDLTQVRVFLDDAPLTTKLDGRALEIDPGNHVLRFEHAGRTRTRSLVMKEGDKQRRVSVSFPATSRPDSSQSTERRGPSDRSSGAPALAYALGGLGVVALGSFAYFGATGVSARSDLDSCKPSCKSDAVNSVDRKFWIANISLAVAAVSLGGAAYLFVSTPRPKETAIDFRVSY